MAKTQGQDFNFFQKTTVSSTQFGTNPDMIITFKTSGAVFHIEGTGVVEYSFNGTTVHGELNYGTNRATLNFVNRNICLIWFRVKSGTNPVVSVEAWAQQ